MKATLTVNQCPALMTRIINIQIMKDLIEYDYEKAKDFKRLEKMTGAQLFDEQCELIPRYNAYKTELIRLG